MQKIKSGLHTSLTSFANMDTSFKHPFTCIVAGPTGCGKTTFVTRLLRFASAIIDLPPERIVWCYGRWQKTYASMAETMPEVEFVDGLPDPNTFRPETRTLVVLDDLMAETDSRVTILFTKKSHLCNTSVVYLLQNLFPKGKENRTISLNAQCMVLLKSPRDAGQVGQLAKQMYPGRVKYMQDAFKDATSTPYGYLLIDLKHETPEVARLRTKVFPDDVIQYVYVPRV